MSSPDFEVLYRLGLGSVASSLGIASTYPIDLVKTRMQNQTTQNRMYKNSLDCFVKTLRHEGVTGLYSGLSVRILGGAPAKVVAVNVHDSVKKYLRDKDRCHCMPVNTWYGDVFAGAVAGVSQTFMASPTEVVAIRMQVMAEKESTVKMTMMDQVRQVGTEGLFRGFRACLLRDVPFFTIYMPCYHNTKNMIEKCGYCNDFINSVVTGAVVGIPVTILVTPADVIKTRIQVEEEGISRYTGIKHTASIIYKEEGGRAFFKGAAARVGRIVPSYMVVFMVYEKLKKIFNIDSDVI